MSHFLGSSLVEVLQEVGRGRSLSQLPEERHHLTAVVGSVVRDVLHCVHERVFPALALNILVRDDTPQAIIRERCDKLLSRSPGPTRDSCEGRA